MEIEESNNPHDFNIDINETSAVLKLLKLDHQFR